MIVWTSERGKTTAKVNGYDVLIEDVNEHGFCYRLLVDGAPRCSPATVFGTIL